MNDIRSILIIEFIKKQERNDITYVKPGQMELCLLALMFESVV